MILTATTVIKVITQLPTVSCIQTSLSTPSHMSIRVSEHKKIEQFTICPTCDRPNLGTEHRLSTILDWLQTAEIEHSVSQMILADILTTFKLEYNHSIIKN